MCGEGVENTNVIVEKSGDSLEIKRGNITSELEYDEDTLTRILQCFSDEPFDLFCIYNHLEQKERAKTVPVSVIRIVYLRSIFNKVNELENGPKVAETFLSVIVKELDRVGSSVIRDVSLGLDGAYFDLAYAIFSMPHFIFMKILKAIEKDSRGQSKNPVWHAVRVDTISATRFFDVFSSYRLSPTKAADLDPTRRGCEAIRFGVQCEPIIRVLLEEFVAQGREDILSDVGLLLDPSSGILGASLDFCVGISKDEDDLLVIGKGATIFEIKCRFKYLRSKDDDMVRAFIDNPNLETFASFILSHPVPAVEFRRPGDVPSGREALISYDKAFRRNLKRHRGGVAPGFIRLWLNNLISKNAHVSSKVLVFDVATSSLTVDGNQNGHDVVSGERGEEYLDIFLKTSFSVPVFVNPRHPYYCQTLLQQYVLSQYYINAHDDPERMSSDELPSVSLVSAILRKRDESECGKRLRINGRLSECENIPLCVIITPIEIDPLFTRDAVNCVLNTWEREVKAKSGLSLWVQSAVNVYVASCIPVPPTP